MMTSRSQPRAEPAKRISAPPEPRFSSEDIHRAIFARAPQPKTLAELCEGIARHVREKHQPR